MHCLVFDCDGVLVESESIYLRVELAFLARHGYAPERRDYVRDFMGRPDADWRRGVGEAIARIGGAPPSASAFARFQRERDVALRAGLRPVDGAVAALGQILDPMCVASSSAPDALAWKLRTTGLARHFGDRVFSTALVRRGKPAPDLFLLAAERMGAAPAGCTVVEDSVNGVMAGRRAGMSVVGFTAGSHCPPGHGEALLEAGAERVAGSFDELLRLIGAHPGDPAEADGR